MADSLTVFMGDDGAGDAMMSSSAAWHYGDDDSDHMLPMESYQYIDDVTDETASALVCMYCACIRHVSNHLRLTPNALPLQYFEAEVWVTPVECLLGIGIMKNTAVTAENMCIPQAKGLLCANSFHCFCM